MRFQIVVTTGNSENWIAQCLRSIADQRCRWPWQCLVIDDASSDGTADQIQRALASIENPSIRNAFQAKRNETRQGALANLIAGFEQLDTAAHPMDVLIPIDGDDWLFSPTSLDTIAALYEEQHCWMTYGGLLTWPEGELSHTAVPEEVMETASYRQSAWMTSHLRSFRSHLWHAIADQDLRDQQAQYYDVTWDMAMMFPMLEMAGQRIARPQNAVYVYNCHNPLSDHQIKREQQYAAELEIRSKPPYHRLTQAQPPHISKDPQNALGYVIISDHRPAQTIRLIESLQTFHRSARIHCVHNHEESILGLVNHSERLSISSPDSSFQRGQFSETEAMLQGIEQALQQWPDLEWLILLDHQCHPLLSIDELISGLEGGGYDAYLHAEKIAAQDLQSSWQQTCWQRFGGNVGDHPFSDGFHCYAGSPWMALRRNAAEALVHFHRQQPWLTEHYQRRDEQAEINYSCESYLHTILCNQAELTISHQPICWADWSSGLPKILTPEDWHPLMHSNFWLAARFQEPHSNRLIDRIHDHWMLHEQHHKITAKARSIAAGSDHSQHTEPIAAAGESNLAAA